MCAFCLRVVSIVSSKGFCSAKQTKTPFKIVKFMWDYQQVKIGYDNDYYQNLFLALLKVT